MNGLQKVEDVKRPLKKGELFIVPCIVKPQIDGDEMFYITPVINHPHSDIENGAIEVHYHADYRFVRHNADGNFPRVVNNHSKHYFVKAARHRLRFNKPLEYFVLPVINEEFAGITPVELISNSKLKHNCIHNGKCPHKGYDLSQAMPINGIITCPLHGLQFDAVTGQVLNFENKNH